MVRFVLWLAWMGVSVAGFAQSAAYRQIDSMLTRASGFRGTNVDSLIAISDRALAMSESVRYRKGQGIALRWKALGLNLSGQDGSIPLLEHSLEILTDLGDESEIAATRNTLATVYFYRGAYDFAAEQWHQALGLYSGLGDSTGITNMWNNLGNLHRAMGQLDRSLDYNLRALAYRERGTDTLLIAGSLNNVANLLSEMKRYDEALSHHERGLELNLAIGNRRSIGNSYMNLGSVHLRNGDPVKALSYYRMAEEIRRSMNDTRSLALVYSGMADAHLALDQTREAARLATLSYDLATQTRSPREARDASRFAWLAYSRSGDSESALHYLERHKALNDSLMSIDNQRTIANLESVLELNRVREDVRSLEIEKRYGILLATVLAVGLIGAVIALVVIHRARRREHILLEELRRAGAIKDRMFSILSHDLRRPLSSLSSLLDLMELESLSTDEWDSFRSMIKKQFDVTDDTLKDLFLWANDQLKGVPPQIQPVRLSDVIRENIDLLGPNAIGKRIRLSADVDDTVTVKTDRTYLAAIIRNLLTNALKFTSPGKSVRISVQNSGNMARLNVTDEGVGIPSDRLSDLFSAGTFTLGTDGETGSGIGLVFVRDLAARIGARIEVRSTVGEGSEFTVVLPAG